MINTRTRLLLLACMATPGCFTAHNKDHAVHEVREYHAQTGRLVRHERWEDFHKGGGTALLADPKASALDRQHVNQSALGGNSAIKVGEVSSVVSTNGLTATGDAAGNILGEASKALLK
jgi:hypothetical protein